MARLALALALSLLLFSTPGFAADRTPPLNDFVRQKLFEIIAKSEASRFGNVEQQVLSLVGREDLLASSLLPRPTCEPEQANGAPTDPLATIVARAAAARLVIINEAHHDPQSRAFITLLLGALREKGFAFYAAETFYPGIGARKPPWPLMSDGFYLMEPVFGMTVRRARTLGFTFVPYEAMTLSSPGSDPRARMSEREETQARNLDERLLKAHPTARALVHVGHDHVLERPTPRDFRGVETMASRLKRIGGTDPLTIEQTYYASPIDRPVICALQPDNERAALTDMVIALPPVVFVDKRPAWRRRLGQKPVAIPTTLRAPAATSIVEARLADEPDEAVPVDRVLVRSGETLPMLLASGRYRVQSWTRERGWSAPVTVVVD